MALSTSALAFTVAAVAAPGTSVSPGTAVPDNCHTVLITNPSAAAVVGWVGQGAPGGALGAGTAQRIPAGTTLSLAIGLSSDRGLFDPAASRGLIFDASGALTLEVTYLCTFGTS